MPFDFTFEAHQRWPQSCKVFDFTFTKLKKKERKEIIYLASSLTHVKSDAIYDFTLAEDQKCSKFHFCTLKKGNYVFRKIPKWWVFVLKRAIKRTWQPVPSRLPCLSHSIISYCSKWNVGQEKCFFFFLKPNHESLQLWNCKLVSLSSVPIVVKLKFWIYC